jgi:hypothetical protein
LLLYVTLYFALAAFDNLFLFFVFSVLTIIWCGEVLFCFCLFGCPKSFLYLSQGLGNFLLFYWIYFLYL